MVYITCPQMSDRLASNCPGFGFSCLWEAGGGGIRNGQPTSRVRGSQIAGGGSGGGGTTNNKKKKKK